MTPGERLRAALDGAPPGVQVHAASGAWRIGLSPAPAPRVGAVLGVTGGAWCLTVLSGMACTSALGTDLCVAASLLALPGVLFVVGLPWLASAALWRHTVEGVELGPHGLRWTHRARPAVAWSSHDLDALEFGPDPFGWVIRRRGRDGRTDAVRVPDPQEAAWLAGVLGAWRHGFSTTPDPDALAALARVRAASEPEPPG